MTLVGRILKYFTIIVLATFLAAVALDAADQRGNFSQSFLAKIWSGRNNSICPEGMVYVSARKDGFCIDKFEASPGAGCPVKTVKSQADTRRNLQSASCVPQSKQGEIPWNFISQAQALEACVKAGKRLPTNEEWYLAALGTPDFSEEWTQQDCQLNSNWDNQPGLTGSGEHCVSAAGAYDMVGNVWEWVRGEIVEGKWQDLAMPPSGFVGGVNSEGLPILVSPDKPDPNFNQDYFWIKDKGIRGIARGGYWNNQTKGGIYAVYMVPPPSYVGKGVGFRCVQDPNFSR